MLPTNENNKSKYTDNTILKFREYERCHPVPFIIYADFECLLEKSTDPNILHKHIPSSFAYYIKNIFRDRKKYKDTDPTFKEKLVQFRGKNAHIKFVKRIYKDAQLIYTTYMKTIVDINMTEAEKEQYDCARKCKLCGGGFSQFNDKVRDHCHISGEYRGPLCNNCNLRFVQPKFIPVIFHNFSRYDAHLFVTALSNPNFPGDISVIPQTEETYISLSKEVLCDGKKVILRFLDSYRFLSSSLASLAERLEPEHFKATKKHFPIEATQSLILRKGVFPYQYIDSMDRYLEPELPSQDEFYSDLSGTHISNTEYQHAHAVWDKFNLQTLGDYSDLYLKCDVLILTDIFEQFRTSCKDNYNLDPAHFFTAPGLSWSAMLKFTNVKLQLLEDYEMILFIERGIRGGVSQVSHRHAKANNRYMGDSFEATQPINYLMYYDVNNLYGWSMEEPLPINNFRWLTDEEITTLNTTTHPDDHLTGYFLEVDLDYPDRLHKPHNDFPLAPLRELVDKQWVSPHLGETYKSCRVPKLLTTLSNKRKYVIHYRTLKLYLELGLELIKVHRVLAFSQRPWLKPYIAKNTTLRQKATDDFGRDLYKLMNNSVFGKTMESLRNRQNIVLCADEEKLRKQIAKPSFKYTTIFGETLAAVHLHRERIFFNKPIYIGMAILDLSKFKVYNFHYNVMVPQYQSNVKVLYHDTDSFMYQIHTENVYHDMAIAPFSENFDTSNYPIPNLYGLTLGDNRLKLGFMKDENKGKIMTEFIGLRSKMYCTKVQGEPVTKKIKGITKSVIRNKISFEDFQACLFDSAVNYQKVVTIQSNKHVLHTLETNKKALCPLDDKKFVLADGVTCLSYGHKALRPPPNKPLT